MTYDVIIAGAGLAGLWSKHKLDQHYDPDKVLLIEREPYCGGRLGNANKTYGLGLISQSLLDSISQDFQEEFTASSAESAGVLRGSRMQPIPWGEIFSGKAAKLLHPNQQHPWPDLLAELSTLSQHPALKSLAALCGITDPWHCPIPNFQERIKFFGSPLIGPWQGLWDKMAKPEFNCRLAAASHNSGGWKLHTSLGELQTKRLVVAHSPWEALNWLDLEYFTPPVLNMALKTKPSSLVVIPTHFSSEPDLPDLILCASDEVHAIRSSAKVWDFLACIPFEQSLEAPEVLKAIKRLRRARRKLKKVSEDMLDDETIILQSVAWPSGLSNKEQKIRSKVSDFQGSDLAFCGDAYGPSPLPEENLISSVDSACKAVMEAL